MKVWDIILYPKSRRDLESELKEIGSFRSNQKLEELRSIITEKSKEINCYLKEIYKFNALEFNRSYGQSYIPQQLYGIVMEAFVRFEKKSKYYAYDKKMCVVTNLKVALGDNDLDHMNELLKWFNPARSFEEGFGEAPLYMRKRENKNGIYVNYVMRELVAPNKWGFTYENDVPVDNFFSGVLGIPRWLVEPRRIEWEINLYPESHEEIKRRLREKKDEVDQESERLSKKVQIWGDGISNYLEEALRNNFDERYKLYDILKCIPKDLSSIVSKSQEIYLVTDIKVISEIGDEHLLLEWFNSQEAIEERSFKESSLYHTNKQTGIYVGYMLRESLTPNGEIRVTYHQVPIQKFFSEVLIPSNH